MKTKWIIIGAIVAVAFLGLNLFIGSMMARVMRHQEVKLTGGEWLALNITGPVAEYNRYEEDFFFGKTHSSVHDIVRTIRKAAQDDHIEGIVLSPRLRGISSVGLCRIGAALEEFRATGKPVEAWLVSGSQKDYWLCTYADRIHMIPSNAAALVFTGVGGETIFYTEALEHIGVKVNVFRVGDSKGAGEPYERTSFSPAFKRNLGRVYDGMYEMMMQDIADHRFDGDIEPVRRLFEERESFFVTPGKAGEWGLVDKLVDADEFLDELGVDEDKLVDWEDYADKDESGFGQSVAVVYAQGAISGKVAQYGRNGISYSDMDDILDDVEADGSIKALVLRVDSPGGSALVSEEIYQRLQRLQEKMPVVVSMAGVAASGGYYISCGADSIYAEPFTITGSIGVVSMLPNFSELADKIDIHTDGVSRGKYAGVFNMWKPLDPTLESSMWAHSEMVYEEFKQRVAHGRGMTLDQVQEIAQGKVYTGQQAIDAGLVDAIGGLNDALDCAARLAGVDSYKVKWFPRRVNMFEEMIREGLDLDNRMHAARMASLPDDVELMARMLHEEGVLMLSPVTLESTWGLRERTWLEEKLLD